VRGRQGGHQLYSFVAASAADMVTSDMWAANSYCRQTAEGLPDRGSEKDKSKTEFGYLQ